MSEKLVGIGIIGSQFEADIHAASIHVDRIKKVVDGQRVWRQRVARKTRRIENAECAERKAGGHDNAGNDLREYVYKTGGPA